MAVERWTEVVVHVAAPDVEAVADLLGVLAGRGVVIEHAVRSSDEDLRYELTDEPGTVRACFAAPLGAKARRILRRRLGALPLSAPLPRLRYTELEERHWSEEWKRFFPVLRVGQRIVVRPSWRRYEQAPDDLVIELDPGRAFGTGQHQTTRLCLRALEQRVHSGDRVIDVGTGSGILAIVAARLGARSVWALDTDVDAVSVARENVQRNGVQRTVQVARGSLGGGRGGSKSPADIVVVNISAVALEALAPQIARALRPGGLLIAAGFLAERLSELEAAVAAAGLRSLAVEAEDGWRCIVASRSGANAS